MRLPVAVQVPWKSCHSSPAKRTGSSRSASTRGYDQQTGHVQWQIARKAQESKKL